MDAKRLKILFPAFGAVKTERVARSRVIIVVTILPDSELYVACYLFGSNLQSRKSSRREFLREVLFFRGGKVLRRRIDGD